MFAVVALNIENEIFVVYIASIVILDISKMRSFCRTQIASLKVNTALTIVPHNISNFADVLFFEICSIALEACENQVLRSQFY